MTRAVTLTNPDKVLYPKDGYTKRDVADYYAAVAEPMLHALADRPLALQHWPNGIDQVVVLPAGAVPSAIASRG